MRFFEVGFASYSIGLSEEEVEKVAEEIVSLPEGELLKDCNFQCPNFCPNNYCPNCYGSYCSNYCNHSPS